MATTTPLFADSEVVTRILDHIDQKTTDYAPETWREPVANYRSEPRFREEVALLRSYPSAFCPSAALAKPGAYVARSAAGTPILAVRGNDGRVRAFRNACRHRGSELVQGSGCQLAFTCRYHGWTYALDGRLRHVPHEHGFPGLDKEARGLVEVDAFETQGLVFVTQQTPARDAERPTLPPLIGADFRLLGANESELPVNWKIFVEGFLEGYHIRSTHPKTFYPIQYDNLNVVERFGDHNRIAFPYQAIERQRAVAPEKRSAGMLTYVYHLFPNAVVATFPGRIVMAVLEPVALDRTRLVNYLLTNQDANDGAAQSALEKGRDLVNAGANEDQEVAVAIQRSLASEANEFFEFGLFEGAIVHFHRTLHAKLASRAKAV
ncbi:MAG TPA: aromatic ring-hydroxylating dioxygenase subunit alpha [Myxococcota bacterium]|nr:aromatic ring-hydroxylating dioxygenase subunit alpha [Myxococcota bacterium]